jgi:archaeal type IV pilus assembly protein PilA
MKMQKNDRAISPVIGVMLMLVVTIIIAAVVSAFAGGSAGGVSKAPQATIQGTYSQSKGMTISHTGGDAIPISSTTIFIRPTKAFGSDYSKYSWQVNKSVVFDGNGNPWTTSRVFQPGDTATISKNNLTYIQDHSDDNGGLIDDSTNPSYGFAYSQNVGLPFVIEFQDESGKIIAQGTVPITG